MQHIEHDIQAECVSWFKQEYPSGIIFAVPNAATHTRSYYYQAEGMLPGAPDLVVVNNGGVAFIEMKSPKGRMKEQQVEFMKKSQDNGIQYGICRSLEDFKSTCKRLLPPKANEQAYLMGSIFNF